MCLMTSTMRIIGIEKELKSHDFSSFEVTPVRFISKGVNSVVYQYVRILENHGCSLLAHPDFSMFFVHLQCKVSNNILIFRYFQC